MHRFWRLTLGILFLGICGWVTTPPVFAHHAGIDGDHADAALPPNFIARTVVSGLTLPTDMVILPSGNFLVTEKGVGAGAFSTANVRFVRGGVLQIEPVWTLGVNSLEESGLLGIVLDPQFPTNHYFYVWYSTGENSLGWTGKSYNRLSRFVFDPVSGKANPATETIILDKVLWSAIHNGGGLAFDDQGNLLLTTGDGGSDFKAPSAHLAPMLTSLNGKVLRIRPLEGGGYEIPSDNPFVGNDVGIRPEIYAYGLRNPFRIARRAAGQKFYIAEVGQETWEEVDELVAGANYGWPYREGKCAIFQRENCTATPPEYTDPVLDYIHPEGIGAGITALTFYEGTRWPDQYRGRIFVADFDSDWVKMADLNNAAPELADFGTDLGAVVDMEATNEGIYVLSIYDQSIKFIYYDEESNQPPTAQWTVTPISGTAPLRVEFLAVAEDLDNDDLYYHWKFGDGITTTTELPTATHVYTQDGDYLATLQVVDEDDGTSEILSVLIQVYSGTRAKIVQENLTQAGRLLYQGGDSIRFRAEREDGTVGLDDAVPYAWTILLHHNEHAHILLAEYANSEVMIDIPTHTHALGVPLWYEVRLVMRTASGQMIRSTVNLLPQTTTIQAQSWPGPTVILLDQKIQAPADMTVVIVGQEHTLEASDRLIHDGKVGVFKNWVVTPSWPEVRTADQTVIVTDRVYTLTVAAEANTYVAFYEYVGPATAIYLPNVYNGIEAIAK